MIKTKAFDRVHHWILIFLQCSLNANSAHSIILVSIAIRLPKMEQIWFEVCYYCQWCMLGWNSVAQIVCLIHELIDR